MPEPSMTHKQRFTAALDGLIPDRVPTFELEFQLEKEMFGASFDYGLIAPENMARSGRAKREYILETLADHWVDLYLYQLQYDCIPVNGPHSPQREEDKLLLIRLLRKRVGDTACLHEHGDGTFSLPDGTHMYEFAYRIADDYPGLIAEAGRMADQAIEHNHRLRDAGIDVFILCSDYCYNSGPFISPTMFSQLITPFLARIVEDIRSMGLYAIKHTDGNIMPILDQLVSARPHALHSLDPMAGVDIATVKARVGRQVALCGNVNCALMQTGTEQEVLASARYCLEHGKPGGGYVFCTSNVPFKGLPADRYRLVLDLWRQMRSY
nr:uroporphyrinogen decarboxylase family protein [bacterium]